jgi:hypothetical protein
VDANASRRHGRRLLQRLNQHLIHERPPKNLTDMGIPIAEPGGFESDPSPPIGIELSKVRKALPELNDGLDAIIAGLERTGCIARSERSMFGAGFSLLC